LHTSYYHLYFIQKILYYTAGGQPAVAMLQAVQKKTGALIPAGYCGCHLCSTASGVELKENAELYLCSAHMPSSCAPLYRIKWQDYQQIMTWKPHEKWSWLHLRQRPSICTQDLRKTTKRIQTANQQAEVLNTKQQYCVPCSSMLSNWRYRFIA